MSGYYTCHTNYESPDSIENMDSAPALEISIPNDDEDFRCYSQQVNMDLERPSCSREHRESISIDCQPSTSGLQDCQPSTSGMQQTPKRPLSSSGVINVFAPRRKKNPHDDQLYELLALLAVTVRMLTSYSPEELLMMAKKLLPERTHQRLHHIFMDCPQSQDQLTSKMSYPRWVRQVLPRDSSTIFSRSEISLLLGFFKILLNSCINLPSLWQLCTPIMKQKREVDAPVSNGAISKLKTSKVSFFIWSNRPELSKFTKLETGAGSTYL